MKKAIFTLSLVFIIVLPSSSQVFWQDNFEGTGPNMGGGDRNAPNRTDMDNGDFCAASDYFFRTNLADDVANGLDATFSAYEGSFYWRGEDLDGACAANPDWIDFTGINITGRTDLTFLGLFGDRDVTSWELTDEIRVAWQIDGGGYTDGLVFEPDAANNTLAVDTDNNGVGDGQALGPALVEVSFTIPGTGTTLDLRVTCNANGGGEEFAFDNFRIAEIVLPVELIRFDALVHNDNIRLNWSTATEINNEKFEIEEGFDGREFQKIGEVKGKGTTVNLQDYSFEVRNPRKGISYYRLKQIDFDGQFEYSEVISVNFKGKNGEVGEFYPNPSKSGMVNLDYTSQNDEEIIISVFDITGKLVINEIQQISNGNNNLSFDFSELNTGIYIVKIGDERNPSHRKLIIER